MGAACCSIVWAAGISFLDPRVLTLTLMLVGVLLAGALVLAWVDRWRKQSASEAITPHDQLAAFRLLYEKGQMSEAEYERVRTKLASRLKPQPDPPAPTVLPNAATETTVPPPEIPGAGEPK